MIQKSERRVLREKMDNVCFDIASIVPGSLPCGDYVRKGELQWPELFGRINGVLVNQALWNKVPERGETGFTLHGVRYYKNYTRDGLREQLQGLLDQHEQLGSAQ